MSQFPQQHPSEASANVGSPPPPRSSSPWKWVAIGCLSVALLAALVCGIGGYWLMNNARNLGANVAQQAAHRAINDSRLPDDQKQRLTQQVDRLASEFKAGNVTAEQAAALIEKIVEGPLLPVGMTYWAKQQYIEPSALSEQQKQQARRTLDRLARGIYDKSIDPDKLQHITDPISETTPNGERQLKTNPTTDELKAFLKRARETVDQANVPDEPFQVDIAGEVEKAVDEALQQPASPQPQP